MSITSRMVDEYEMVHFDYENFHKEQYNISHDYNQEEYLDHLFFEQCRNEKYEDDEDDGIEDEDDEEEWNLICFNSLVWWYIFQYNSI